MKRAVTGWAAALLMAGGLVTGACADKDKDKNEDTGSSTGTSTGSTGKTGSAGSSSDGDDGDDGTSSSSTGASGSGNDPKTPRLVQPCSGRAVEDEGSEEICQATAYMSEPMPVDLYIMMDRSSSMAEKVAGEDYSRWEGIREAVVEFVNDPDSIAKDIRMGIGFFNQTGAFIEDIDCDIDNYSDPASGRTDGVAIASVADEDQRTAIAEAIDAVVPGGQTPTMPALQGALRYAKKFNTDHGNGRAQAVVLVTDGLPTQCQDPLSVPAIAEVAQDAYFDDPSVPVFVVGIGPGTANLDQIAQLGGTEKAYLFEEGAAASDFIDTLKTITLASVSCAFEIPPPPANEMLDLDKVRMRYTPDPSDAPDEIQEFPYHTSVAGCMGTANGGWYYDNPNDPTAVIACPCTCARIRTGLVEVQYGCAPIAL